MSENEHSAKDAEFAAAHAKLAELQARAGASVAAHSAALKMAAKAGWPDDLTEAAERSLAAAEALHREAHGELEALDKYIIQKYGVSLSELDKKTGPKFDSSFWKSEITTTKTTGFLEEALERGLDKLLTQLSPHWLKRQYALAQAELNRRNAMPFMLIGNARQEGITSPHYLGYALFLTDLFLNKKPEIEVYDAALLIPMIAALCDRLDGIHAVKGGKENLQEMLRKPNGEFRGKLYELLVAGRAAQKGYDVEFIATGPEVSPDLRIHNLGVPLVIECKFQSQWSETEQKEIGALRAIFDSLCEEYVRHGMTAAVELTFVTRIADVRPELVLRDTKVQLDSLIPYGKCDAEWGTFEVLPLDPEVEWNEPTRLFSPNYLSHVFRWNADEQWDGICASVQDKGSLVTQRARLPFCVKWRLVHKADEWAKARDVMRSLQEAANQVPVGEIGCLYVGFEDSHRGALADLRTRRNIDRLPNFHHRKRGANIAHLLLNRLYPRALGDGKPDLVESCIPVSQGQADEWPDFLPTTVFVPEP